MVIRIVIAREARPDDLPIIAQHWRLLRIYDWLMKSRSTSPRKNIREISFPIHAFLHLSCRRDRRFFLFSADLTANRPRYTRLHPAVMNFGNFFINYQIEFLFSPYKPALYWSPVESPAVERWFSIDDFESKILNGKSQWRDSESIGAAFE